MCGRLHHGPPAVRLLRKALACKEVAGLILLAACCAKLLRFILLWDGYVWKSELTTCTPSAVPDVCFFCMNHIRSRRLHMSVARLPVATEAFHHSKLFELTLFLEAVVGSACGQADPTTASKSKVRPRRRRRRSPSFSFLTIDLQYGACASVACVHCTFPSAKNSKVKIHIGLTLVNSQ